ncbi:MAG TPA: prolipoprotein diacylglyceryl transferase [Rhizomicrobium sp.]
MFALIPYPHIDPVLLQLGPFALRWYALAYIAGVVLAWWGIVRVLRRKSLWAGAPFNGKPPATEDQIGDLVIWATLGVIIGGRLGYDLFYGVILCGFTHGDFCNGMPMSFLTQPWRILAEWNGFVPELRGMSFHGGAIGVAIAVIWFCRRQKLALLPIADLVCAFQPIGQFFGRIANFINGELWGKPSDVPWAMIFPRADGQPRHPSQLYEAGLEGIALFIVMQVCLRVFRLHERPGLLTAIFLASYGAIRFFLEFFREPDSPFIGWFSMGMALSILLWIGAGLLFWHALRKPRAA